MELAGVPSWIVDAVSAVAPGRKRKGKVHGPDGGPKQPYRASDIGCIGGSFAAGTAVWTGEDGTAPIEALRVGDRVRAPEDEGREQPTEVNPATWQKVRLYMPNPGDAEDVFAIETLKPAAWVTRRGVAPGAEVWVPIDESGLAGWARVDDVLPCPPIRRGPGRVVLTTITHMAPETFEFVFEGADPPLRMTGNHEFYSATRKTWIPALLLVPGEEVATRAGTARILRIERREGSARVFNLEVEAEHCYHVMAVGVVTHNCGQGGKKIPASEVSAPPPARGRAPIGSDAHPVELHHRGQQQDSPLDEMTRTEHRLGENYKKNHRNTGQKPSAIDRSTFDKERAAYWQREWDSGRFHDSD